MAKSLLYRLAIGLLVVLVTSCSESPPPALTAAEVKRTWTFEDSARTATVELLEDGTYRTDSTEKPTTSLSQVAGQKGLMLVAITSEPGTWKIEPGLLTLTNADGLPFRFHLLEWDGRALKCRLGKDEHVTLRR